MYDIGTIIKSYIHFLDPNWWFVSPFLIIGSTLLIWGCMFLVSTAETCIRLGNAKKRVQDPEIDSIDNLHMIKHWMEPGIDDSYHKIFKARLQML